MDKIRFRKANSRDLPAIVALLADDPLGKQRESTDLSAYAAAFAAIDTDPNQLLAVVEDGESIVGTLQLTFIPGLSHGGAWRGQIEAVRVASDRRGQGIGHQLFDWAIAECRARGCRLVQLTTDGRRTDARRFYEDLGFVASHIGYKLKL